MTKSQIFRGNEYSKILVLIFLIILSCTFLIYINHSTIRILSGIRAYVNGESHYSKAQKDAARNLITYLYTENEAAWDAYLEELRVPKGDSIARVHLIKGGDVEVIKDGFRQGRNDEKDLDDIIWLFKSFKNISFFANAVNEWEEADNILTRMQQLANQIRKAHSSNDIALQNQDEILAEINELSTLLTLKEKQFSEALGEGSRSIKGYLLCVNILFIFLIFGCITSYYFMMTKKLIQSKKETEINNEHLVVANNELDKFVYSASHDLRSPITSLKGLIEVAQLEESPSEIKKYLRLMYKSLVKQDQFISDIVDYSRNKRKDILWERVEISELIEDVLLQHISQYSKEEVVIEKDLCIDSLYSDSLRLRIILNNLISNALKYADTEKEQIKLFLRFYASDEDYIIEIEDNGIGIREELLQRIFEMFFVTNTNLGSGLGLYITKQAVENLNGTISVDSVVGQGTLFTITIPMILKDE